MTEPPSDYEADLRVELRYALLRPLPRTFEDGLRGDATGFPILAEIVGSLRKGLPLRDALRDVIRVVLPLLPDDEFPAGKTGQWKSVLSWRAIGWILTGFADDLPPPNGKERHSYDDLCAIVRERADLKKVPESSFGRHVTGALKDLLADILINRQDEVIAKLQPRRSLSTQGYSAEIKMPYVERLKLHNEFIAHIKAGAKVIVFVGHAGMGKTSLAEHLTTSPDGARAPKVTFSRGVPDICDVQRAMVQCGVNNIISDIEPASHHLIALCCGEKAPSTIVLDNLDRIDELHSIFPNGARSTIVATSRTKGDMGRTGFTVIQVDGMQAEESNKLVHLLTDGLEDEETASLAQLMQGFPLAIASACALITQSDLSVADFESEFTKATATEVSRLRTQEGPDLAAVTDRLVKLMAERSRLAFRALGFVVNAVRYEGIPSKSAMWYLVRSESDVSRLEFEEALLILVDYSFIKLRNVMDESGHYLVLLDIHPLVAELLSRTFSDDRSLYLDKISRAFGLLVRENSIQLKPNCITYSIAIRSEAGEARHILRANYFVAAGINPRRPAILARNESERFRAKRITEEIHLDDDETISSLENSIYAHVFSTHESN